MRLLRVLPASLLIATQFLPAGAHAGPPARESTVIVFGEDACPGGEGDEIVVCARRPESERYRIPRRIRERQPTEASWGSRVESLDEVSRAGRPGSCSPVGSFGQSGCSQMFIQQWYADRRARREAEAGVP
jgi:hypothetical protein